MVINTRRVKILLFVVNILTLVFLLVFITAKPIVNGYSVYKQLQKLNQSVEDYTISADDLRKELSLANDNLTACFSKNQKILADLQSANDDAIACLEQTIDNKKEMIVIKEDCEADNQNLREEIGAKTNEFNILNNTYHNLVNNTANNICCKAKIDNLNIRYYRVSGGRIICGEEGAFKLSCPSLA